MGLVQAFRYAPKLRLSLWAYFIAYFWTFGALSRWCLKAVRRFDLFVH